MRYHFIYIWILFKNNFFKKPTSVGESVEKLESCALLGQCKRQQPLWKSQVTLAVKNSPANAGDTRDARLIPGAGRSSGVKNGTPLHYSFPGKFHGQRSLEGYSPQDRKESDTTE